MEKKWEQNKQKMIWRILKSLCKIISESGHRNIGRDKRIVSFRFVSFLFIVVPLSFSFFVVPFIIFDKFHFIKCEHGFAFCCLSLPLPFSMLYLLYEYSPSGSGTLLMHKLYCLPHHSYFRSLPKSTSQNISFLFHFFFSCHTDRCLFDMSVDAVKCSMFKQELSACTLYFQIHFHCHRNKFRSTHRTWKKRSNNKKRGGYWQSELEAFFFFFF